MFLQVGIFRFSGLKDLLIDVHHFESLQLLLCANLYFPHMFSLRCAKSFSHRDRAQEQHESGPQQGQRGVDEQLGSRQEASRVPAATHAAAPESRPGADTGRRSVHDRSALSSMNMYVPSFDLCIFRFSELKLEASQGQQWSSHLVIWRLQIAGLKVYHLLIEYL